ncbi:hypothetical protein [Methanobrevibacter sp.]
MTAFTQDKIFKNVNQEDARILLNILGIESENIKIWTKELRLLDPKDYRPDILLELDNENLIIELQSKIVDDDFSARGLTYVAIANRDKENNKEVNLMVLSSIEDSKTIKYSYNRQNDFVYNVVSLRDLDIEEIINNIEPKIKNNEEINGHDLVLYALLPIIDIEHLDEHIKRVTFNLLNLKGYSISLKELSMGIEWLLVDNYVTDEELRNILCDALGEKMSLIYEYGDRKEKNGIKEGRKEGMEDVIKSLLKSGMSCEDISQRINKPLNEIYEIADKL